MMVTEAMRTTFIRMATSATAASTMWIGIPAGSALRTSTATTSHTMHSRMVTLASLTMYIGIPAGGTLSVHSWWQ